MNKLTLFEKNNWKVRTLIRGGEPWFVARDVCGILEIGNITDALCRLDEDEKEFDSIETLGGKQQVAFVTEAGLYSLVLGSRKPEAREFKRWVTHEIIPAIRKHGMYATPAAVEAMLADPDTMIKTLQALKDERKARQIAEQQLAIAAPKAEFYDAVTASPDTRSIGEVAKILNVKGIGQNKLFAFLKDRGVLRSNNQPYQSYVNMGYFELIEQTPWRDSGGVAHVPTKTVVTQRGIDFIRKLLNGGIAI